MISPNRDILVLLRSKQVTEKDLKSLHRLLHLVETPYLFCLSNELVDRDRVTSDPKKLLKESARFTLRPFRFFLNKN
jgi:hypothetical protein